MRTNSEWLHGTLIQFEPLQLVPKQLLKLLGQPEHYSSPTTHNHTTHTHTHTAS